MRSSWHGREADASMCRGRIRGHVEERRGIVVRERTRERSRARSVKRLKYTGGSRRDGQSKALHRAAVSLREAVVQGEVITGSTTLRLPTGYT